MSLTDNIMQIVDAFKEKRAVRTAINKINRTNEKERNDELLINSFTESLMNVYYSVKEQARLTNINLDGFIIEPKNVLISKAGTNNDPRVLIEAMAKNPKFQRRFLMTKRSNEFNQEQYVITEKHINIS